MARLHLQFFSRSAQLEVVQYSLNAAVLAAEQAAENAAKATEAAKGSYGAGHGEEFLLWVFVVWGLRSYAESLEAGAQPKPISTRVRDNDQTVAQVFPAGWVPYSFPPSATFACSHCMHA